MPVSCPYCGLEVPLKAPPAGRYSLRCPDCGKKFAVTVPERGAGRITVTALKSELGPAEAPAGPPPSRPSPSASTEPDPSLDDRLDDEGGDTTFWNKIHRARPLEPPPVSEAGPNVTADQSGVPPLDPKATVPLPPSKTSVGAVTLGESLLSGKSSVLTERAATLPEGVPAQLGGYQLVRPLGVGGMGAVYLARQVSLDRHVALKVMKPELAHNPTFLARFTREAYAAAQLNHHNIVQIYDFGEDKGTSFFSMELVDGKNLSELVREKRKLDPEAAVGLVLQAARGLKFAHDQSLVHRDIKPENLMLNRHGVVKVADLGLVKSPRLAEELDRSESARPSEATRGDSDARLTADSAAMGTPAFMAPEQARDAASVDARADIYALGCTLYDLVTGRPPFEGTTAMEVLTKHQTEPMTPPEVVAKRVPKALSEIILKMTAKRPEDRFQDLDEVIRAFEHVLGARSGAAFSPREDQAEQLEHAAVQFANAPTAKWKPRILALFFGVCGLLVLLNLLMRWPLLAGGFFGLGLMTGLAYFILDGSARRTPLFVRFRGFLLGGRIIDWLTLLAGLAVLLLVLWVFKLFWVWVFFLIAAVLLGWTMRAGIDRQIAFERAEPIHAAEKLIKGLRLQGVPEDDIRQFVCKYAGSRWEEFFEAIFGYEAKLEARRRWGMVLTGGKPRPKFAAWREPLIGWFDAKAQARRESKERALLQKIEERGLVAKGENLVTARRKSRRAAEAMVSMASELRSPTGAIDLNVGKALREAARRPESVLQAREHGLMHEKQGLIGRALGALFGPRPRFLVGTALVLGCLVWMQQNGIITREHLEQARAIAQNVRDLDAAKKAAQEVQRTAVEASQSVDLTKTKPLKLPLLPERAANVFNGFGPGVAGLILMVSALFRGARMSLFVVPAAAIALFGPSVGVPALGPLSADTASIAIGVGLFVLGAFFGRARR